MSKKLYVGNLSWGTTEDELKDLFAVHGAVEDVKIITDRETGKSRGFGFVTLTSTEDGDKAISALHEQEIGGRKLTVNEAREKTGGGGGGGGGGRSSGGAGGNRNNGGRGGYRDHNYN